MMSLFKVATEHVVANAGPKTLRAVADLNSAERFQAFSIVERKKSFWFWKEPSMIPTYVTLNDLLKKGGDIAAKEKEFILLKNFEDNTSLDLNVSADITAKVAAKIAQLANIKLDVGDKMKLDVKLGDVVKSVVPWQDLYESMKNTPIDITHPLYIHAAKQSPKVSLCVVIETLATKDCCSINKNSELKVKGEVGMNLIKVVSVKAGGCVDSVGAQSYTIPPGTVLAYSCVEFAVDANGNLSLHDVADTLDNQDALLDSSMLENPFARIRKQFEPLSKLGNLHKFQEEIKLMLASASESDLRAIHILLYYANSGDKSFPVSRLEHLLGVEVTSWKALISFLGFSYEQQSNTVIFPSKPNHDILKACMGLVDSILDCYSNCWKILPNISHEHAQIIMKLIEREIEHKHSPADEQQIRSKLESDPSTLAFLANCGFKSSGNTFTFTGKDLCSLLDVYAVMYFLSSGKRHCSIL